MRLQRTRQRRAPLRLGVILSRSQGSGLELCMQARSIAASPCFPPSRGLLFLRQAPRTQRADRVADRRLSRASPRRPCTGKTNPGPRPVNATTGPQSAPLAASAEPRRNSVPGPARSSVRSSPRAAPGRRALCASARPCPR